MIPKIMIWSAQSLTKSYVCQIWWGFIICGHLLTFLSPRTKITVKLCLIICSALSWRPQCLPLMKVIKESVIPLRSRITIRCNEEVLLHWYWLLYYLSNFVNINDTKAWIWESKMWGRVANLFHGLLAFLR